MNPRAAATKTHRKNQKRFLSEINYMKAHWSEILTKGDPYYNENFSLNTCNYTLRKR